jgi:hypothetical protein
MVTMETGVEELLTLVQSSTPDELIKQSDLLSVPGLVW